MNALEIQQCSIGIRPSPKAEKQLHCSSVLDDHWAFAQRKWWIQSQLSFKKIHCSTTCSSSGYFKIVWPYYSAQEVENVESHSLLGSSCPDSRIERPLHGYLSQVAKNNWEWAGCDLTHDYKWWKLNSPLQPSHKTGKHALEVSVVLVKKKVYWAKLMNTVKLTLFFDVQGAVYQHTVPHHTTVNAP